MSEGPMVSSCSDDGAMSVTVTMNVAKYPNWDVSPLASVVEKVGADTEMVAN
jgi:hypothetical protein